MSRAIRRRWEAALIVLLAVATTVVGGGALYFVSTMAVHSDPAAVPSTSGVHAERYSGAIEESRRLAHDLLLKDNLPGLSVAVARDGEIVWTEGLGWADVEDHTPATPRTQFRLGSVSKTLTAAAIALLHERGRIDLDAPVQTYVPAYPQKPWTITTRQLMGDIAGVHRIRGDNNDNPPGGQCASLDEALATFADEPLLFEPGARYRFSTYGWILLSAVVEAAAGEPFSKFLTREILEPLDMESTVLDDAADVPEITSFYIPRASMRTKLGVRKGARPHNSCLAGAGAFFSTPSDLVRFGSSMLKPGLLKAETLALLQTPLRLESGASTNLRWAGKSSASSWPARPHGWLRTVPPPTAARSRSSHFPITASWWPPQRTSRLPTALTKPAGESPKHSRSRRQITRVYADLPGRASACGAAARRSAEGAVAGAMFWFTRNRFAGSYFALTCVSRS